MIIAKLRSRGVGQDSGPTSKPAAGAREMAVASDNVLFICQFAVRKRRCDQWVTYENPTTYTAN
jgi:hypothetical protein